MESRLLQLTLKPAEAQVLTQVHLSTKEQNGITYFLQTTLRFLRKQLLGQQVVVLKEQANNKKKSGGSAGSGSMPLRSTAAAIRGLTQPAPRFGKMGPIHEEGNIEAAQADLGSFRAVQIDENGHEHLLSARPMPRRQRTRSESDIELLFKSPSALDELFESKRALPPGRTRAARRASFSVTTLIDSSGMLVAAGDFSEDAFTQLFVSAAIMMALQRSLHQYLEFVSAAQSETRQFFNEHQAPSMVDLLRARDFGNPLQIVGHRLQPQPPNPNQMFALNYYRPSVPRPLALPSNQKRLDEIRFPSDLVPERFKCEMMGTLMSNPVKLPGTGQICDGATVLRFLQDKAQNPYNRQPMTMDDAQPELGLRGEIARYVDAVVKGVGDKRKDLGRNALSPAEYQSINENALMTAQDTQAQATSTALAPRRR